MPRRPPLPAPSAPASRRDRPGRPPTITDEKILETARDVFLEHGIRATTAEVARRAKISEGTIFHRFKSKDALFRAAMRFDPAVGLQVLEALIPAVGSEDLTGALLRLGEKFLELGRVALPAMMMSWSNPSGEYSLEKLLERQPPLGAPYGALARFLEGEMNTGRLARTDAQILGRTFIGALRGYCMSELLSPVDPTRPAGPAFVRGLVELLIRPPCPALAR